MYSIANIIYGIPLTNDIYEAFEAANLEPEDFGFEELYHGSSNGMVGYFGVELTTLSDNGSCKFSSVVAEATVTDEASITTRLIFDTMCDNIRAELADNIEAAREIINTFPALDTYIVWSTS